MYKFSKEKASIGQDEIINNNFSFAPSDFREMIYGTNNKKTLGQIVGKAFRTGSEISSESYIKKSKIRFIKTNNIGNFFLPDYSRVEYAIPNDLGVEPKNNSILIVKDGGTGGLGEVVLYTKDNSYKDYISAGIIEILIEDIELRCYVLGILKSKHFKEFIDNKTPGGSTIRHSKLLALEYEVPLPNNKKDQRLLSILVQNIIDKEEKIRDKNLEINRLIKNELSSQRVNYPMPESTEIISNNFRFDSGLYDSEYKTIKDSIVNYQYGCFSLLEKYTSKRGPNLAISVIGESIYSDTYKNEHFYKMLTNVEFTDNRTITGFRYLGNKEKLPLIPKKCIMLSADGSVGRCIFVDDIGKTITNYHPWMFLPKDKELPIFRRVFTAMFLGWLRTFGFYEKIQDKSNGGGIKLPHLENWIKIPNFPDAKQKEISIKYHNTVEANKNLTLDTYLEKEKERNSLLGIWQLNMELFTLKEQVERLVHKIVYDEEININDYL